MPRRPARTAAFLAAVALSAGGGAAVYAALSDGDQTVVRQVTVADAEPAAATTSALSIQQIYQRTNKGVVEITVTSNRSSQFPFGEPESQRSQGSGFVYDTEGNIVTNQHVVDNATSVAVRFWNGATYKAKVVGSDASTDLAVIKVNAPASLLTALDLGDSSKVAVGDGVVAIGSPFGLEETVTSGIVSALHRSMTSPNDFAIADTIQTDAAINHGNSGGPLLSSQAEVIGVNAQIESDSGGNDGVGFSIPSNTVESIASQLIESGEVKHAFLGVSAQTIPASVAERLDTAAGVEVTQVRKGTPAERANLHAATGTKTIDGQDYPTGGDVITEVDGEPVASSEELVSAIDAKKPGDDVTLTVIRKDKTHKIAVTLASRPS